MTLQIRMKIKMTKDKKRKLGIHAGAGVAIGAAIGTALFGATQEPVWIAVGVTLGATIVALGISKTVKDIRRLLVRV